MFECRNKINHAATFELSGLGDDDGISALFGLAAPDDRREDRSGLKKKKINCSQGVSFASSSVHANDLCKTQINFSYRLPFNEDRHLSVSKITYTRLR